MSRTHIHLRPRKARPVRVIETKVSLPAIVTGLLGMGGGAVYAVLLAYEAISPTPEQAAALVGLGSFALFAVQTITGYLADHTPRPDLAFPERVMEDDLATGPEGAGSTASAGAGSSRLAAEEYPPEDRAGY